MARAIMTVRLHGFANWENSRGLSAAHFERWLGLFRQTAWSHCPPGAAHVFEDRALRIAASLQAGLNIPHAAPPALHTTGG